MAGSTETKRKRKNADHSGSGNEPTAIVGIGVCLASLGSIETLFEALSQDLAASYVVAVRQQDGLTTKTVVEALAKKTQLPASIAKDGERLKPNRIYVRGPNDMIAISDGHLAVRAAEEPVGRRGTVDSMLISLSEHAQDRAIAVILSGLGSEGTAGVTTTKKFGGLSIAESRDGEAEAAEQGAATPAGVSTCCCRSSRSPGRSLSTFTGSGRWAFRERSRRSRRRSASS